MSVTENTLQKDVLVSAENDLVRAMRDRFGMTEKVAVLVLAELSAWSGSGYKSSLTITSAEVRDAKAESVLNDFNGRNHREVMRRHSICRATLYNILKRCRAA